VGPREVLDLHTASDPFYRLRAILVCGPQVPLHSIDNSGAVSHLLFRGMFTSMLTVNQLKLIVHDVTDTCQRNIRTEWKTPNKNLELLSDGILERMAPGERNAFPPLNS
jgi:hypothetical protein